MIIAAGLLSIGDRITSIDGRLYILEDGDKTPSNLKVGVVRGEATYGYCGSRVNYSVDFGNFGYREISVIGGDRYYMKGRHKVDWCEEWSEIC